MKKIKGVIAVLLFTAVSFSSSADYSGSGWGNHHGAMMNPAMMQQMMQNRQQMGGYPMMGYPGNGYAANPQMMQQMMAHKQGHMGRVEALLKSIDRSLKTLVEQQKQP